MILPLPYAMHVVRHVIYRGIVNLKKFNLKANRVEVEDKLHELEVVEVNGDRARIRLHLVRPK